MSRLHLLGVPAGVLLAVSVGACSGATVSEGDALFRRGEYQQALAVYEQAGDAEDDSTVGQRIRRTRYFVLEDTVRSLLHENRAEDALQVIAAIPEVPPDREAELDSLRLRSRQRLARKAVAEARAALEDERPEDALTAATRALTLDPQVADGTALRERAMHEIDADARAAEAAYLDGMEELRQGYELRARSAFQAALARDPEDPRAASRLEAVTRDLADDLRRMGRLHLQAGKLGQAWVTLNDALRLDPADQEGAALLEKLEIRIQAEELLASADLAVRAGHIDAADELLVALSALDVELGVGRADEVATRSRDARNHDDYVRARAYELDNQAIHALGRYAAILKREKEYGWEDVELRTGALERRIAEAATVYERALAAERAGDAAGYRAGLEQVLQLASDYGDALRRYRELTRAEAGPEVEPNGGDEGI